MQKLRFTALVFSLLLVFSCSGKSASKPDAKFDGEKTFAKASDLMERKEYEDARTLFSEIKSRDLTKKYAPLAQMKIAESYLKDEDPDRAVEEYRKFLAVYPDHKYAPYAQYQIANIYFDQIDGPERGYGPAAKALEELERMKRMFPRNPFREIVEGKIEKCRDTLAEYEYMVGNFYYKKDSYDAAINRYLVVLKKYPSFKLEADVLYHLGMSYKSKGDNLKAEEYFKLIIEKFPTHNLASDAKKALSQIKK